MLLRLRHAEHRLRKRVPSGTGLRVSRRPVAFESPCHGWARPATESTTPGRRGFGLPRKAPQSGALRRNSRVCVDRAATVRERAASQGRGRVKHPLAGEDPSDRARQSTPERRSLSGSQGRRPWFHTWMTLPQVGFSPQPPIPNPCFSPP